MKNGNFKLEVERTIAYFCLVILLFGAGKITAQESIISETDSIRLARLKQNHAMACGDVELAASFWTDDVTLRRGLGSSVSGKDAYSALLDTTPNDTSLFYVREPDLIEISSDWPLAYESGTWAARYGSIDGPLVITGRYSAQWVKREGNWLIRSEVFVALNCYDSSYASQALP